LHPKEEDKSALDLIERWDASIQAWPLFPMWSSGWQTIFSGPPTWANAFLAQQSDVMDAVQRMRKKAQDKGNLKSTEQQRVETKVIESKSVIVVEQANPQVVYVPSYDPVVVTVPPSILILLFTIRRPDIMPAVWRSRCVGIAMGRSGAGLGLGMRLGRQRHQHHRNNNFNRNTNVGGGNRNNIGGGNRPSNQPARAMATGRRLNRFVAVAIAAGNSDRWQHKPDIAAERRIGTGRLRTGLGYDAR